MTNQKRGARSKRSPVFLCILHRRPAPRACKRNAYVRCPLGGGAIYPRAERRMSGSVNKVILVGNLGADPEVRSFQNGGKVANIRIATSEQWKDRNSGDRKEKTEWHTVAIFSEGLVNVVERFLRKGSK